MKRLIIIAILLFASVSWAGCKEDVCKSDTLPKYFTQESRAAGPITAPIQLARMGVVVAGAGVAASGGTATVGYTDYTSSATQTVGRIYCYGPHATTGTGAATVTKISAYFACTSAGQDIKLGLYTDSAGRPASPVAQPTEFLNIGELAAGWHDYTVDIAITKGSTYWVCINVEGSDSFARYYLTTTGIKRDYDANAYANAWADPFVSTATGAEEGAMTFTYSW
jgi:hypothetical protein